MYKGLQDILKGLQDILNITAAKAAIEYQQGQIFIEIECHLELLTRYSLKIPFNIILPSISSCPKWSPSLTISYHNLYTYLLCFRHF